ncbi:Hypp635 [Branchiostoma lanceolatum]|uniref:Hypp635 protein n=1 Tax=Branchiostoma lanceolatum TaxID=7740 RepID=A0A8J9VFC6_BRALA|nr:Hypp635 [Branchiostoma lanceolatum]
MSRRGFSYPPDDDSPNLRNDDISDASSAESPTENASAVFNGPREGSGQPSSPHGHTGALPPTRVPMTPAPENRREKQTNGRVPTPQTLPMNRSQAHGRLLQQILDNQQEILKRVAKVEHQLEDLQTSKQRREEKQNKPTVPNDVRSLVKEGYDHCVNTGGRAKWNLAKGMKANSVPNDETTKAILGYVQGLMSDYTDKIHTVKAAVDTYFDSKRREEMRTKAGKIEKHQLLPWYPVRLLALLYCTSMKVKHPDEVKEDEVDDVSTGTKPAIGSESGSQKRPSPGNTADKKKVLTRPAPVCVLPPYYLKEELSQPKEQTSTADEAGKSQQAACWFSGSSCYY